VKDLVLQVLSTDGTGAVSYVVLFNIFSFYVLIRFNMFFFAPIMRLAKDLILRVLYMMGQERSATFVCVFVCVG